MGDLSTRVQESKFLFCENYDLWQFFTCFTITNHTLCRHNNCDIVKKSSEQQKIPNHLFKISSQTNNYLIFAFLVEYQIFVFATIARNIRCCGDRSWNKFYGNTIPWVVRSNAIGVCSDVTHIRHHWWIVAVCKLWLDKLDEVIKGESWNKLKKWQAVVKYLKM